MSQAYAKSKSGGILANKLHSEIAADGGIAPTCESVTEDTPGSDGFEVIFDTALSAGEETTLDGIIATHTLTPTVDEEVLVREVSAAGQVQKETVYTNDARTVKVREDVFTYSGNRLVQVVTTHYSAGASSHVETTDYFEDQSGGVKQEIEKRS